MKVNHIQTNQKHTPNPSQEGNRFGLIIQILNVKVNLIQTNQKHTPSPSQEGNRFGLII